VRDRPRVEVQVEGGGVVREGQSFEVVCRSSAYPKEVAYRWFFDGSELEGVTNNSLLVEEITREHDQADISCTVANSEGEGRGSATLEVQFPPTLLVHPESQVARRKEQVTFHCVAEGNPLPSYLWTRGRQDTLLQAGRQNLSLVALEETEGVYRCHVFAEGSKLVSSLPASLTLLRAPKVAVEGERRATAGQDAILTCSTRAVTPSTSLRWLRSAGGPANLQPVELADPRVEVTTEWKNWVRTSSLLIRNVATTDFGQYACFAENEVGTDVGRTELRQAGLDLLTAVAAVTCVLAILMIISIFLCVRLRSRCAAKDPGSGKC